MSRRRAGKRQFGSIRALPSGRYQARYTGPGGVVRKAPVTFDARIDAEAWLARQRGADHPGHLAAARGSIAVTNQQFVTFGAYATSWLAGRTLATTTRDHYAQLLRDHILPAFGTSPDE